jgi:hypothetical protein
MIPSRTSIWTVAQFSKFAIERLASPNGTREVAASAERIGPP